MIEEKQDKDNMDQIFRFRAYATLMLFGDCAVRYQGFAICSAVDQYMTATARPRKDSLFCIKSDFGVLEGSLNQIPQSERLNYVRAAIQVCQDFLTEGFDIEIDSHIIPFIGLGSSVAVVSCLVGVLCAIHGITDEKFIIERSQKALKQVFPDDTGCECVASIMGMTVAYNPHTKEIVSYLREFDLTLLYTGEIVDRNAEFERLEALRKKNPVAIAKNYEEIHKTTNLAMRSLENNDLYRLGELMNQHRQIQDRLVENTPLRQEFAANLANAPQILGVKFIDFEGGRSLLGLGIDAVAIPLSHPKAQIVHLKTVLKRS